MTFDTSGTWETYKIRYRTGRAHQAVTAAIKRGDLKRPDSCSECGCPYGAILMHHDDYKRPLDVRALCCDCHYAWHSKNSARLIDGWAAAKEAWAAARLLSDYERPAGAGRGRYGRAATLGALEAP